MKGDALQMLKSTSKNVYHECASILNNIIDNLISFLGLIFTLFYYSTKNGATFHQRRSTLCLFYHALIQMHGHL